MTRTAAILAAALLLTGCSMPNADDYRRLACENWRIHRMIQNWFGLPDIGRCPLERRTIEKDKPHLEPRQ